MLWREAVRTLRKSEISEVVFLWSDLLDFLAPEESPENLGKIFARNAHLAAYDFDRYRPKKSAGRLKEITVVFEKKTLSRSLRAAFAEGEKIAAAVNLARDLANTPGSDMPPKVFVREARGVFRSRPVKVRVLTEKQMKKLGMNGVLAVGRGSAQESLFLVLEYRVAGAKKRPLVLVGKGVTFDSGGIDTKPHPHGCEMMMDMSGAAAVLATLVAAADLGLRKNLVGLIPLVENMPDGSAMKPGDIIKMMDGTTVEVGHTDAEGRIILADALAYAKRYRPHTLIDVATLTGAAVVALGERAGAVFSDDDDLAQAVIDAGENNGEYLWRLPLWEEYEADIKGSRGQISNINTVKPGAGGAITAAAFLKNFVKKWQKRGLHIDMAPLMTALPDEHLAKGAKGAPVATLVELARKL